MEVRHLVTQPFFTDYCPRKPGPLQIKSVTFSSKRNHYLPIQYEASNCNYTDKLISFRNVNAKQILESSTESTIHVLVTKCLLFEADQDCKFSIIITTTIILPLHHCPAASMLVVVSSTLPLSPSPERWYKMTTS